MSTAYADYLPSTREIRDAVAGEIEALGGRISDVLDDKRRLFVRAVLGHFAEIRPRDAIQAGIAVRATSTEILIHPYTFRKVCSNGAIATQSLESRRLERIERVDVFAPAYDVAVVLADVGAAVRACAAPEVFATNADEIRSTVDMAADLALQMLHLLARSSRFKLAALLPLILEEFATSSDRSAFGVMNAVTSVARDTRDPTTRWELEDLGGSVPSLLVRRPRLAPATSMVFG